MYLRERTSQTRVARCVLAELIGEEERGVKSEMHKRRERNAELLGDDASIDADAAGEPRIRS